MNNKVALSSLAMDLKRVALGYWRGGDVMAQRFAKEALSRSEEINLRQEKPYVRRLLKNLNAVLSQKDRKNLAEDALMYSILFQNAALQNTFS